MEKYKYTNQMYEYLVWRIFQKMYNSVEWAEEEGDKIDEFVKNKEEKLTDKEKKIVDNRVLRMNNEYEEHLFHVLVKQYNNEFEDCFDDYDYREDDFAKFNVSYNEKHYEIWLQGVRKRQSVKIVYDSNVSGMSKRIVDPYRTRTPYGDGYCHNKKEVRKFRFDRVIDIKLTNHKFIKSKNWKK